MAFSRSCLLHRFIKNEWRVVSSQTIGVEFSSKIVKVGTGARRKRIKLQLWDTAGTERFRSVSRSYYRGAAGAILVYDTASSASFNALPTFLMDARALASPNLTVILAGNKADLGSDSPPATAGQIPIPGSNDTSQRLSTTPSSVSSKQSSSPFDGGGSVRSRGESINLGSKWTATTSQEGREVTNEVASRWASKSNVPVAVEVSALSGDNVDELFNRLARMILTKIELGEIDPDDPQSGIQYGDGGMWGASDGNSIKSGMTIEDASVRRRNKGRTKGGTGGFLSGAREWEDVFRLSGSTSRRGRCC
jgi:small GTP-binding protein